MNTRPQLSVRPIHTEVFHFGMDLHDFIFKYAKPHIREGSILAITSKILSVAENRGVPMNSISKRELIEKDCDVFLCETSHGVTLTIKEGLVIPSSGIDESNSEEGHYLLYPKSPYEAAKKIYDELSKKTGIQRFGIIITDSHTSALRKGVTGIALSHYGFKALRNLVGQPDLFGRKIKMTSVNVLDSLTVSAVLTMGEAAEACPLALIEYQQTEFTHGLSAEETKTEIQIPLDEDLYGPLLTALQRSQDER